TKEIPPVCLFRTPHSPSQVRDTLSSISSTVKIEKTVRLVFRKIGQELDRQGANLVAQDWEIQLVKHHIEELSQNRGEKSFRTPNLRFAHGPVILKPR
ncbi:hypothetical protein EDB80DRAFT_736828, partial [Ilyonectria destructans]